MSEQAVAEQLLGTAAVFELDAESAPSEMDDQGLYFAHSMCHAFYQRMNRSIAVKGWSKEKLIPYFVSVVKEMISRDMLIVPTDDELGESIADLALAQPVEKILETNGKTGVLIKSASIKTADAMAKALQYFQKYEVQSILTVLRIAEEGSMLKTLRKAQDAEETANAPGSGGLKGR